MRIADTAVSELAGYRVKEAMQRQPSGSHAVRLIASISMDASDLEFAAGHTRLVTVGRYRDLPDADIARSVLDSAGIETYLQDEHVVSLNWNLSDLIGGVRLQVEAADEQAALELLRHPVLEMIDFGDGKKFVQPRCPTCGSGDVSLGQYYGMSDPRPADRDIWRCNACEECWEVKED